MDRKLTNWKLIVVGQNWTSFENTDKLDTTDKSGIMDEIGNDGRNW